MNKYTTEKEISDMLKQVSHLIAPTEIAFSKMLSNLPKTEEEGASIPSIYVESYNKNKSYFSFKSLPTRVFSGFAIFVFVLGGIFTFGSNDSSPKNPSADQLALQKIDDQTNNNTNDVILAVASNPVSATSISSDNLERSVLAVASLKSSSASPETSSLQEALVDELSVEINAHTELLALSE